MGIDEWLSVLFILGKLYGMLKFKLNSRVFAHRGPHDREWLDIRRPGTWTRLIRAFSCDGVYRSFRRVPAVVITEPQSCSHESSLHFLVSCSARPVESRPTESTAVGSCVWNGRFCWIKLALPTLSVTVTGLPPPSTPSGRRNPTRLIGRGSVSYPRGSKSSSREWGGTHQSKRTSFYARFSKLSIKPGQCRAGHGSYLFREISILSLWPSSLLLTQ
jgi:hypothetical protein